MNAPVKTRLSGHALDRKFLAWIRSPSTTRAKLVVAREKAMRDWQFIAIQRELDRREGLR